MCRVSSRINKSASHASCCAIFESTRGHHAVANLPHEAAKNCGTTAETAIPGLGHRLAPSGHTHVCSLQLLSCFFFFRHAFDAGVDCTNTTVATDLADKSPHQSTFRRENISNTIIDWSAHGRLHPDTLTVLHTLSKRISRSRDVTSHVSGSSAQVRTIPS